MNMKLLLPLAACLLGLSAFVHSDFAQTAPTPTPPTAPGGQHQGGRGVRHPAIWGAIRALERAKADLQAANHDFGGHKEDAITACENAIAQLKLALQYANQNTSNPATPSSETQPNTNQ